MELVPTVRGFVGEAGRIFDERLLADDRRLQDRLRRQHLESILDTRIAAIQEHQNYERQMGRFIKVMHTYATLQIELAKRDHKAPDEDVSGEGAYSEIEGQDGNSDAASSLEHIYE